MKQRFIAFSLLAALAVVAGMAGSAFAQDARDTMPAKPMWGHVAPHVRSDVAVPATALTTFNGSFTNAGHSYPYTMVGTSPSTGTSTTFAVYVIPIKLSYTTTHGTQSFSPTHVLSNGQTVLQNVLASPIFNAGIDFVQGGTDLGNTQYIDAFQRGNFWNQVKSHTGYHILLGTPTVEPLQTLSVPSADGKVATEFGVRVGLADINWFDSKITAMITAFGIPNTALPIFVTYDSYLTSGGCCIGGYHNAIGSVSAPQTYAHFTYVDHAGVFSQDVSALSHEVGEWADDPYVGINGKNNTPCGILEVGDPEEGFSNFGAFPYTLNGFTYNLQDLVWLPYFGAAKTTSANGWFSFQGNTSLSVCSNGP
jgi:hypothetical protein